MNISPGAVPASTKRNVAVLAVCQALFNSTLTIQIGLGSLVGEMLASNKSLSTLPITMTMVGTALSTIPASHVMRLIGRQGGFMLGTSLGLLGCILACVAIVTGNFVLYCFGALLFGSYSAAAQYFRFAAADIATDTFRPRAISYVVTGGLVAGFLGPEIAKHTKDLIEPYVFLGAFVAAGSICLVALAMQTQINIPRPTAQELRETGRPLAEIIRQPLFVVAVMSGVIGYAVMNFLMTATPLAMVHCTPPFSTDSALTVVQWHVVAMFAPGLVTGSLISRFGVLRIIITGVVLNLCAIGVALAGLEFLNFSAALVLLGVGWNFMYVGGTTLLTKAYKPAEKAKAQAANDFTVFGVVAIASVSSGALLFNGGWTVILLTALPLVAVAGAAVLWLMLAQPAPRAA